MAPVAFSEPSQSEFSYKGNSSDAIKSNIVIKDYYTYSNMTTRPTTATSITSESSIPRYFTSTEVSMHNAAHDLWVSWLGHVYDLTSLAEEYKG